MVIFNFEICEGNLNARTVKDKQIRDEDEVTLYFSNVTDIRGFLLCLTEAGGLAITV